jgi:hypothetical protein
MNGIVNVPSLWITVLMFPKLALFLREIMQLCLSGSLAICSKGTDSLGVECGKARTDVSIIPCLV